MADLYVWAYIIGGLTGFYFGVLITTYFPHWFRK